MKIKIPKVVRELALSDYAAEYGDAVIHVWVNPNQDVLAEYEKIRDELDEINAKFGSLEDEDLPAFAERMTAANKALNVWLADLWSQSSDPNTHWTLDEVQELAENSVENDPALWVFVQSRSLMMIAEYRREGYKKKFRGRS